MAAVLLDGKGVVAEQEAAADDPANAPGEPACIFPLAKPRGLCGLKRMGKCLATLGQRC